MASMASRRRKAPAPPRLDEQLCFALHAASRMVEHAYAPLLRELGVTYSQLLVLMVLWETDDVSVSDIGRRLLLDSGTLTPLLKRLERAEILSRTRDPADERRVRIRLTERGRALGDEAAVGHHRLVCELDGAVDVDLSALRDTLRALIAVEPPG